MSTPFPHGKKRKKGTGNGAHAAGPQEKLPRFDDEARAEERELEALLLSSGTCVAFGADEDAFEEDVSSSHNTPDSGLGEDQERHHQEAELTRPAAWIDEDDEGISVEEGARFGGHTKRPSVPSYKQALVSDFMKYNNGKPRWAEAKLNDDDIDSDDDLDCDEGVLRRCGFVKKIPRTNLASSELEFKKVLDLNHETRSEGFITCIEFHPKSTVGLVAGRAGIASLFAVDGKNNHKLHNVSFDKFPIYKAAFTRDGNEAILGSNRRYMYNYDLIAAKASKVQLPHGLTQMKLFALAPNSKTLAIAGKWGEIHVVNVRSKERVALLKQDSPVTSLAYDATGHTLYGHSSSGEVTIFDTRAMRVRHKWIDSGCLEGSTLALSSTGQFVAAGSMQGVVNLYGCEDVVCSSTPQPRKSIFNLTTAISSLAFNETSEILALSSQEIKNSIRLFHVGAGTVFSNFPMFGTHLGEVTMANFSPGSGYFAVGNRKSVVTLYRLHHYKNY